jgi:RNA polymerase sigma-70 factor (ECF subfamily)
MVGNWADASDLSQETFIRAYHSLPGFRRKCSFSTWIYHIAVNICRDELRKKNRRPKISLDEIAASSGGLPFSETGIDCPEDKIEQLELQGAVQECLNALPDEYRLVLIMREIQGLSYEEIASALRCSVGTVKSRLSRSRTVFKQKAEVILGTFSLPGTSKG